MAGPSSRISAAPRAPAPAGAITSRKPTDQAPANAPVDSASTIAASRNGAIVAEQTSSRIRPRVGMTLPLSAERSRSASALPGSAGW